MRCPGKTDNRSSHATPCRDPCVVINTRRAFETVAGQDDRRCFGNQQTAANIEKTLCSIVYIRDNNIPPFGALLQGICQGMLVPSGRYSGLSKYFSTTLARFHALHVSYVRNVVQALCRMLPDR
ncbi:hypothetical protein GDI3481 [Gluconacetobacter diazotrophicus PA1 5]|uniref:Uncharacterized protein n=1 Tax=Gluconacetobacter diazotrophicus (strain ATCC 49037 / DSM 5601 / CCUG 37298 / CIP 103539 / LMG 7603 / PAl5) TaxID=272568 RepID=A9H4D7_GLUDA|nr:hypothetical protein GDI3481 [Gluconacetobacter diazotrophicus PA1 5]